jgi:hypothetical protein
MKINWKHLATTTGYKSLKKACFDDIKRNYRSKKEVLQKFRWVIARAKHYVHHTGKSIESILNEWEEKRDYWWINYYQDGRQPKFHSNCIKKSGINSIRKYYKNIRNYTPVEANRAIRHEIARITKTKKLKPRWPMARKKRGY